MIKKPTASISSLTFSDGTKFELQPNEKILLVGPNNSGKSQALREIVGISQNSERENTIVIKNMVISKSGDAAQLREYLTECCELVDDYYRQKNWQIHQGHVNLWDQNHLQYTLAAAFIMNIDANNRLKISENQSSIGVSDRKSKPQHVLYDSSELMDKISALFRRAFGKDLMFDFRGGSEIPIHVGDTPPAFLVDRVSDEYVNAVRKNPLLERQGDGMKSYAGILFEAIVADLDIILIDEPEAFLHPPQMRRLGETLVSEVKGQLIVATHSSDIMRGFLEGNRGIVRILRIRREGNVNIATEASTSTIRELWEKPELRYSNALEGIFHDQTIICEDDSDCRLINSIADHISSSDPIQWNDTAYVPTGGKHGIPKVASVLRKIGVPVKAVFDLDFLSEGTLVQSAVLAFGGRWADIEPLWRRLDSEVRKGNRPKTNDEINADVKNIVSDSKENELRRGDIIESMKQGSPWYQVKKYGVGGIPNGDAQKTFRSLRDKLEEIGIYVVPVGEIENFCPTLGSHGPKFVNKLLSEVSLADGCLSDLREFVTRVHKGSHSR